MPRRRRSNDDEPGLFSEYTPGRITIFDLETTGLDASRGARAVEICAVRLDNGKETGRMDTLLNPGTLIPANASAIHGITDAMVLGFPSFDDIIPEFLNMTQGGPIAAYNANFDLSFLDNAATRLNVIVNLSRMDLIPVAKRLLPGLSSYQLWQVKKAMHYQSTAALHRAAADVDVCLEIWRRWQGRFAPGNYEEPVLQALEASQQVINPNRKIIEILRQALQESTRVRIYFEGNVAPGWREVTPITLQKENGSLTLRAFCHLRNEERNFTVDRIKEANLIN